MSTTSTELQTESQLGQETQSGPVTLATKSSDKMNRRDAKRKCWMLFGPKAEIVRVSDRDRRRRFLVVGGVIDTGSPLNPYVPNLLGSGDCWESAIAAAEQSPGGESLKADTKDAVDLIRMAGETKSPQEFVDRFAEQQLEIAKGLGASEEDMVELKSIFEKARTKLTPEKTDADHSP